MQTQENRTMGNGGAVGSGVEHRTAAEPMTSSATPNTDARGRAAGGIFGLRSVLLTVAALATFSAAAAVESREALWGVVQMCRINSEITGAAFPCLEANVKDGVRDGYVVLRPPLGSPDFILSPTRKISGVEESGLAAEDAPNYFEMAWSARSILARNGREPLPREDVALAVNSELARTQDQLHIHIGCLSKEVRQSIVALMPELSPSRWRRPTQPIKGMMFWARIIGHDSLAGVNPFRIVAESLPDARADPGAVNIVVAGARSIAGRDDFVLLADIDDRVSPYRHAGSDVLSRACP
jgi:CDP-diacylglycerol pyrophosphatase